MSPPLVILDYAIRLYSILNISFIILPYKPLYSVSILSRGLYSLSYENTLGPKLSFGVLSDNTNENKHWVDSITFDTSLIRCILLPKYSPLFSYILAPEGIFCKGFI